MVRCLLTSGTISCISIFFLCLLQFIKVSHCILQEIEISVLEVVERKLFVTNFCYLPLILKLLYTRNH
ncbi:hypothetical protein BDF20DRAFT_893909 [Mycotypha africana]|uniref:uncharacterized protein n=1 Tax=Mycotypha africana TaxID=64632 RepID=UPI0022FFE2C2|nr:uncharacterized protein BDF20DRAFT_893909 [Mycotypha africana]KAI8969239.1 hypothetical protein BDF20DRAFT_893909 [Mycotypha africana]